MSDPNDKLLDDYLRRDSVVSKSYRELTADDVPPSLDAAVLAQARAAIAPGKRSQSRWLKWGGPVALAASAVMAVAIVLEIGVDEEVRLPARTAQYDLANQAQPTMEERVVQEVIQEAPVSAAAPPTPKLEVPKPSTESDERSQEARTQAKARAEGKSTEREAIESISVTAMRRRQEYQDAPMAVAPVAISDESQPAEPTERSTADSAAGASSHSTELASDARESEVVTTPSGVRAGVSPRARDGASSIRPTASISQAVPAPVAAQQAPRLAPEPWLEQIRSLRREGKVLEADEQWKEFSAAYPQYEVEQTDAARPPR